MLKNSISVLVFENVFIALCAVAMVQVSLAVLLLPPGHPAASSFVFFSTLLVYNLHKSLSMLKSQSLRAVVMLVTTSQLPLAARLLIYGGAAGASISFFFLIPAQQILVAALACLTLAYSFPILKIRNSPTRIRELFFIKVFVISGVWSLVTVLFPIMGETYSTGSFWLLFAERLLFVFAITIPFEIRDMEQEKKWGNKTIPVVLGPGKSKTLGYLLVGLFIMLVLVHFLWLGKPDPRMAAAMILSAASAVLVIYHTHENRTNFYYKFYVDGTMMLQYIFVILFC